MVDFPRYTKNYHHDVYSDIDASRPELSAKGNRVVITGGGGGIGAATAEAFAVAGASEVIILGRTEKTLKAVQSAVEKKHKATKVTVLVVDISDPIVVAKTFATIAQGGLIDIFINNAAYTAQGVTVDACEFEDWWKAAEINFKGSLATVQKVLKNIRKGGTIVNVATLVSTVPYMPGSSAYAATKLGSAKLFEYVQNEHPELNVFNIQPGIIPTTTIATKSLSESGLSVPYVDTVELPANFMVWLSSPEGRFLKGRFIWANWDVQELKAKEQALQKDPAMLTLGLVGWPQ